MFKKLLRNIKVKSIQKIIRNFSSTLSNYLVVSLEVFDLMQHQPH